MATIDELISSIEVEQAAALKRRDSATTEIKGILAVAGQDGRSNLTDEEDTRVDELTARREKAVEDLKGIRGKLEHALRVKAEEAESANDSDRVTTTTASREAVKDRPIIQVGAEERTYHPGNDPTGRQFFLDVLRRKVTGDVESDHRLARHMAEERVERGKYLERAVGTSAFAGLTVPQYLTDLYAPDAKALRPFADACNGHVLPSSGMSIEISKITTASGAANQASQNSAVQETNMDDTVLSVAVKTAAGQQTVSRQAIERGTGIEEVVVQDLFGEVETVLDNTLLNEASTGLTNVANSNSYTDASPTAAELYPVITEAAGAAETAFLQRAPVDLIVMHPRRWYWLLGSLTANHPLLNSGQPGNASGVDFREQYGSGFRGTLAGLPVVVDANVLTDGSTDDNEDEVYVVSSRECHLWEDGSAPMFIRAEQTAAASLGVLLVAYKYYAYTHNRYSSAQQKIAGTGLVAP